MASLFVGKLATSSPLAVSHSRTPFGAKPAKATNSAIFAVLLLTTGWTWAAVAAATVLLVVKCVSLARLVRLGLPVPGGAGTVV